MSSNERRARETRSPTSEETASELAVHDVDRLTLAEEPATLVRNSGWSFLSQAVGYGVAAVVSIIAVRSMSPSAWGEYSVAIALISLLTIFSDLGVAALAMRELSTRPRDEHQAIFGLGITAVTVTGIVGAALVLPLGVLLGYDTSILTLLALGAPAVVLQALIGVTRGAFNARRQLVYVMQFNVAQAAAFGTVALALLAAGFGASGLVAGIVVGNATAVVLGIWLAQSRLGLVPRLERRAKLTLRFIRNALPIAVVGGIAIVYDRVDVVLLSQLTTSAEVARYSVPYTLAKLTWAIPSAIAAAFFPLYTRIRTETPPAASRTFFLLARVFTYLSVSTALFLSFAGEWLLTLAFGSRYGPSAPVLTVLAWSLVTTFQGYLCWYGLLAIHSERRVVPLQLAGLAVNVGANLLLIPKHGAVGAAWAYLLADVVAIGGQFLVLHRHLHRVPVRFLVLRPLVAVGLAVSAGLLASAYGQVLAAGLAVATYALTLQLMGYVTPAEWQPVTGPVRALALRMRRALA